MSITSDLRTYADIAREQGKQALGQAQSQFADATGSAKQNVSDLAAKATETVGELRAQAEKAVNIDAIKSALEPYVAQAKGYSNSVTDRAEGFVSTVAGDSRLSKLVSTAEALTSVVVDTVNERLVKPVHALTGLGKPVAKPTEATKKPTAAKPATTRPATKPVVKTPATKPVAKKAAAKKPAAKAAAKKPATASATTTSTTRNTAPKA